VHYISMLDLTKVTATELSSLYQSGAASPVTVAQQVLDKIERLNPILNAFCFTDPDTTIAQAQASERRWQQGQPLSELDGVPVAIKDSILTQGWPTRHASHAVDLNQPWLEDAPAVARLREAGAVFVGKTTMSEFGSTEKHSNSLLYGNVCNPWNLSNTPGGSSGGSAVAVAAGLVPVALGTDLGGSISVPSAFCGVFGIRPSTGRIPQWPIDALELSAIGPMARSTADIKMIMNVITRPDVRDGTSLPYNDIDYHVNHKILWSNKKIACVKSIPGFTVDSDVEESVEKIVDYLLSQGAHVDFVSLDIESGINVFLELALPRIWQQWSDIPEEKHHLIGRDLQRRAILAHRPYHTHDQLIHRQALITKTRKIMQSYDVILGPVAVINSDKQNAPTENISPLSIFFCATKQPNITIPVGLDRNSMPQSVMIAGAMHDDVGVLQVAHAIESAFPMPGCSLNN
jgi:aspartyl-tRNA(Asn)/glutamyl-tRNA(Gln) amidotransferase subunit A